MYNPFKSKVVPSSLIATYSRVWRPGMWVTYANNTTGILVSLGDPCVMDVVNATTGETVATSNVPLSDLRQAKWSEIPAIRRQISKAKGAELGYGS